MALDGDERVVGHAAYVRTYGPRAEIAVETDDDEYGLGLPALLITELARVAQERRIDRFVLYLLPDNHAMLALLCDAFGASAEWDEGVVYVDFPTAAWNRDEGQVPLHDRALTVRPEPSPWPLGRKPEGGHSDVRLP